MADKTDLPVILSEAAISDLSELGSWIARQAGSEIAEDYVSRVETACERIGPSPTAEPRASTSHPDCALSPIGAR